LSLGYKYEEIWESDWLKQREKALEEYPPYEPDLSTMIPIEEHSDYLEILAEIKRNPVV
jgi:hypothetical protein